jgi:hypothetical protein
MIQIEKHYDTGMLEITDEHSVCESCKFLIQVVSYHVTSKRKFTSTTYAAAQATLVHT